MRQSNHTIPKLYNLSQKNDCCKKYLFVASVSHCRGLIPRQNFKEEYAKQ
jgi:hypothetical protein